MIEKLPIEKFLELAGSHPVLDVRSPGEFAHAHIPGAFNLPLFSDEERKVVGTTYKQIGRQPAIKVGLDYFGVKMRAMVDAAEAIIANIQSQKGNHAGPQILLVHCWRGGMRSAGVAWLLDLYGYKVYTLAGGYKAYRGWVLGQFENAYPFRVLGGFTGSGKTAILHELAAAGKTVLDLELIAHHKGSAFGDLGEDPQPRHEMFENQLAMALNEVSGKDEIWIEDESRRIGDLNLPLALWNTMRSSPVYFLDVPFEERLDYITVVYGKFKREDLMAATMRIRKRLGGLNTKLATGYLIEDNIREAFRILLAYYDKFYGHGLYARENYESLITKVACRGTDARQNIELLLGAIAEWNSPAATR